MHAGSTTVARLTFDHIIPCRQLRPTLIVRWGHLALHCRWLPAYRRGGKISPCPEAFIPDPAVQTIRLFEQSSLGFAESKLTLVFPF